MSRSLRAGVLLLLLSATGLGLWWWQRGSTPDLIAPLRLGAEVVAVPVEESLLLLPLQLHAEALTDFAAQLPQRIEIPSRRHEKKLGPIKLSAHSEGEVLLSGLRISSRNGGLQAQGDADVHWQIRSGRMQRSVDARAQLQLHLRADIDSNWALQPEVELDYRWLRPPHTSLAGFDIDLSREADRVLRPRLRHWEHELAADLARKVDARAQAQALWARLHQPLALGTQPPLWLQIEPLALVLATPQTRESGLELVLGVRAHLRLVNRDPGPVGEVALLPALDKGLVDKPGLRLSLDIEAGYPQIEDALRSTLGSKAQELGYAGQRIRVQFEDFSVYPSAPNVVIGSLLRLDSGLGLSSGRGWVYLQGRPRFDNETDRLLVEGIDFHGAVDNPLLQSMSELLRERLLARLAAAAQLDLAPRLGELRLQADQQLQQWLQQGLAERISNGPGRDLAGRVRVTGRLTELTVGDLITADQALLLRLRLEADLALALK